MIHGYVAKVHDDPADSEFKEYGGTVDVGEYPDETASTEPLVLGNELAQLMLDFMTECSKIMTPTLMGTMTPVNFPNFISLSTKIHKFLSKTSYTK